MPQEQPLISRVSADVLTGYYKRERLNQEDVAERSGIPLVSLQKKLRGKAPITATDFVVIARAIGVDPVEALGEVLKVVERRELEMSEGVASISDHRTKKSAEIDYEALGGDRAATTNPEHEHDEPETP